MVKIKRVLSYLKFWRLPKRILIPLITLMVFFGGYYLYSQQDKPKEPIQTTQVKRQDIKSTVSASGEITGEDSADLKFKVSGKLAYLNVTVGDTVLKGQAIAGLDTQDLNITLQQAQNTLRDKQAIAEKAEDDVKDHSKDESFAQKVTRTTAQAARDSAFDAVKEAQRAFQDTVIYSPLNGIITKTDLNVGQNVTTADIIAQVVNIGQIYFDAEVDESDIGKVQLGQKAEIILNSFENKVFEGNVSQIKPVTKETSTGATVVIVRINLGNPEFNFVSGLNGQAEIIYKQVTDVLSVPLEAVEDNKVTVKEGNRYVLKNIKTGISSDTDIEVTEGLKESEIVVTNPGVVKL